MALKYQVAILSVWWNRGEVDTRLFSSKSERDNYFNNKNPYWNSLNNFNIRDNITTTIVFRDNSGRTIDELLKCNYAIVRHQTGEDTYTYRYFYIVAIEQDSNNQIICTLDLDDVQNNLYDLTTHTLPIYVKNWTGYNYKSNNNILYYPLDDIKPMAQSEDSPSLYNTNSERIKIKQYDIDDLDTWLNENIESWRYIFVVDNNSLVCPRNDINNFVMFALGNNCITIINNNAINLPYKSLAEPNYRTDKRIYIKYVVNNTNYYMKLISTGIEAFFNIQGYIQGASTLYENNPMGKYGINAKYSVLAPFELSNVSYEIDEDGDLILTAITTPFSEYTIVLGMTQIYRTMLNMTQYGNTTKASAEIGIVGGIYQTKVEYNASASNPIETNNVSLGSSMKILDKEYTRLRVRIANQHYDYNPLALITFSNSSYISFKYTEVLKAGITKAYLRAVGNGLYTDEQEQDYTGLIASMDLTEPILENQWADYFASHKNYYMQTAFNNTFGIVKGTIGASVSKSTAEGAFKLTGTFLDYGANIFNQEMDKDNMKQAPDSLSNANGDPYFNLAVSGIAPMLDLYQTKDLTRDSVLSKFMLQGMPINTLMSTTEVFYSHRSYDALSCNIFVVPNYMSSKEFERLRAYLSNNHRYWYNDTMDLNNPYIK